jgi:hypothetical protein
MNVDLLLFDATVLRKSDTVNWRRRVVPGTTKLCKTSVFNQQDFLNNIDFMRL